MSDTTDPLPFKTVSGRWVVIAMLAFGILATGSLWVYSKVELARFVPFLKALRAEFPEAKARVEGGRPKHQAPLLRVVMQVEFTPRDDDERVADMVKRVVKLAKVHVDLSEYERLELHIVRYIPQKNPERVVIKKEISEL